MTPPRVYFFCCNERTNLQDDIVQIAEGLEGLGIPFFANVNYWLKSPKPQDYLIRATPDVTPDDCDVVVFPYTWFNWVRIGHPIVRRPFPAGLFKVGRRYLTVYMDTNDQYRTVAFEPEFRNFDVIFRTKYNTRFFQPSNFRPWNLGMSSRIIRSTQYSPAFANRRRSIVFNFGASHPHEHQVRRLAKQTFRHAISKILDVDEELDDLHAAPTDPYERLMWEQTTYRHSANYYARLKNSQAVACFCGQLVPCFPRDPTWYTYGGRRAEIRNAFNSLVSRLIGKPDRIVQWDSWRFWEALGAGCAAFNIDLEKYGATIPVMPGNWTHYIGVELDNVQPVIDRLYEEPEIITKIGSQGHDWALTHYAPEPTARRFLHELGFEFV